MEETLFKNCIINLKLGTVKTKKGDCHKQNKNGYHCCKLYDLFGNKYYYIHQVIIAEGLKLPKHLWPRDEFGKLYVVDHIIPVSNGGTDSFENLHLIPNNENPKNPFTRINNSKSKIGKHQPNEWEKGHIPWNKGKKYHTNKHWSHSDVTKKKMSDLKKGTHHSTQTKKKMSDSHTKKKIYQYSLDGILVGIWNHSKEAAETLKFNRSGICMCCNGQLKTHKGYRWSYEPL